MQERSRRRILVLTPRDPYPTVGGDRLRIHRLAKELSTRYELTLLTLCGSKRESQAPPPDDGVFKEVHRIVLPQWRSWINALAALPSRRPLQVAYYQSRAFHRAVQALAPRHDAVVAHLVRTAEYARDLPGVRMLEMTDAISMSMQRTAEARADYFDLRRYIYRIEARRLAAYERQVADDFDLLTLTSPVDSAFIFGEGANARRNLLVAPNGSDIPSAIPSPLCMRRGYEIAFVGNLHALQNFDAAWFFARQVLPQLRVRFPQIVFRIIGPIRSLASKRLAALPGVRVDGVVPRLDVALSTTRIGVCPVRTSAGVQNKILDYFGNRLAVVSSPNGLEGLDARANEHLLLAETPEQWVTQVTCLLEDESTAQRLADAGRELVRERYTWEGFVRPVLRQLDVLLARSAPAITAPARAVAS